ncbi:MAG: exodeoxyribonuclease VII small subunit [Hyphomicrobiales bacterium]|nr:exodeoxyribonuclease VII small subunit [Hyphomicrobiales bacterium]
MTDAKTISELPFEQAMKQLEEIVARLEKGDISLEDSIAAYERGELLKKRCEDLLKQAEARIEKIRLGADGKPAGTSPLDVE